MPFCRKVDGGSNYKCSNFWGPGTKIGKYNDGYCVWTRCVFKMRIEKSSWFHWDSRLQTRIEKLGFFQVLIFTPIREGRILGYFTKALHFLWYGFGRINPCQSWQWKMCHLWKVFDETDGLCVGYMVRVVKSKGKKVVYIWMKFLARCWRIGWK